MVDHDLVEAVDVQERLVVFRFANYALAGFFSHKLVKGQGRSTLWPVVPLTFFCAPIYISHQFEAQRYWSLWQRGWRIMSYIKKKIFLLDSSIKSSLCQCLMSALVLQDHLHKMNVAPIFEHSFCLYCLSFFLSFCPTLFYIIVHWNWPRSVLCPFYCLLVFVYFCHRVFLS